MGGKTRNAAYKHLSAVWGPELSYQGWETLPLVSSPPHSSSLLQVYEVLSTYLGLVVPVRDIASLLTTSPHPPGEEGTRQKDAQQHWGTVCLRQGQVQTGDSGFSLKRDPKRSFILGGSFCKVKLCCSMQQTCYHIPSRVDSMATSQAAAESLLPDRAVGLTWPLGFRQHSESEYPTMCW